MLALKEENYKSEPDPVKVFEAIARILTAREWKKKMHLKSYISTLGQKSVRASLAAPGHVKNENL